MIALILSLISLLLCFFSKGTIGFVLTIALSVTALIMARKSDANNAKYAKIAKIISCCVIGLLIGLLIISFITGLLLPIIGAANDFGKTIG